MAPKRKRAAHEPSDGSREPVAKRPAADDAVVKALRDNLSCVICTDVYEQPCTLPCGHTLCRGCITSLVSNAQKSGKCPTCRADFTGIPALNYGTAAMVEQWLGMLPAAEQKEEYDRRFQVSGMLFDTPRLKELVSKGVSVARCCFRVEASAWRHAFPHRRVEDQTDGHLLQHAIYYCFAARPEAAHTVLWLLETGVFVNSLGLLVPFAAIRLDVPRHHWMQPGAPIAEGEEQEIRSAWRAVLHKAIQLQDSLQASQPDSVRQNEETLKISCLPYLIKYTDERTCLDVLRFNPCLDILPNTVKPPLPLHEYALSKGYDKLAVALLETGKFPVKEGDKAKWRDAWARAKGVDEWWTGLMQKQSAAAGGGAGSSGAGAGAGQSS